jgi:hypothetical protein
LKIIAWSQVKLLGDPQVRERKREEGEGRETICKHYCLKSIQVCKRHTSKRERVREEGEGEKLYVNTIA